MQLPRWRRSRHLSPPSSAETDAHTLLNPTAADELGDASLELSAYTLEDREITQEGQTGSARVWMTLYVAHDGVEWYVRSTAKHRHTHAYSGHLILPLGVMAEATGAVDDEDEPGPASLVARRWARELYNQVLAEEREVLARDLAAEVGLHRSALQRRLEDARAQLEAATEELRRLECSVVLHSERPRSEQEIIAGLLPSWEGSAAELEAAARSLTPS